LIGINVAVRAGAQGIGFALPIDDIKPVAAELLSTRRLVATWHGLIAGEHHDGETHQVLLSEIQPGSPGEEAGLQPGDRIVRIGDLEVANTIDIERGLLDARPGQKVSVEVRRQGRDQRVVLEPRSLPRVTVDANEQVWRLLGLKTRPVSPEYVAAASEKLRGGLYIQAVEPGSPAALASLRKGDILVGMNVGMHNFETIRPDNILYILRQPEITTSQAVQFFFVRRNSLDRGVMNLAELSANQTLTR
jgi:serine protease Do